MDSLFLAVLNMSLTGAFVIFAICLARVALKNAPKIIPYCLWLVAGLRLVFPFSIESVWSLVPFRAQPISPVQSIQSITADRIDPYMSYANRITPAFDNTANRIITEMPTIVPEVAPAAALGEAAQFSWTVFGAYVWLLGIIVMLSYGIASYIVLSRKMRDSVNVDSNIYESKNIQSPFVLGIFRPRIYLPAELLEQEREYVILHEQIHIRRRDHIIKLAAFLILILHWFNPLVWLAFSFMSKDMEMSCDERVLKEIGINRKNKEAYTLSLVSFASEKRFVSGSPLAFGESGIKGRVKNILNFKTRGKFVTAASVVLAFVLGVGLMVSMVSEYYPYANESDGYAGGENDQEPGEIAQRAELAQFIDNLLTHGDRYLPENNFWGTILVKQGDDVVIHRAFGYACAGQNIKNTLETSFDIGSVTKQITGGAVLALIADGKLCPSDTLDMFFPAFDGLGLENVTLADLLTMRGGFGNYFSHINSLLASEEDALLVFQELLASLPEEDRLLVLGNLQILGPDANPLFVLGELQELESIRAFLISYIETHILTSWGGEALNHFSYSNSDYWLLGRIIEHASGMTYEEFITTRIFEPAGMQNSGFRNRNMPGTAVGHGWDGTPLTLPLIFAIPYSSAGIISTTGDLSLWLDAYFGGKLFPKEMLSQGFYVGTRYNYGWFFIPGGSIWWHYGTLAGFRSILVYDRDNDTRSIILTNWDNRSIIRIQNEISARVFNRRIP